MSRFVALTLLVLLAGVTWLLYRTNLLHHWLPQYAWLQHHKETALLAEKDTGHPGQAIVILEDRELDQRLTSRQQEIEALEMEMPVEVVFERSDRWGDRVLPRFRRIAGTASSQAKGAGR